MMCTPVLCQSLNSNLSHEWYYHQMTSETTVTIPRHDKKWDLDIIPTFVGPRKLMQRYKTLIDCSSLGTNLLLYLPTPVGLLIRRRYLPIR